MTLFRLSDEYSRFYLKYIESNQHQGKNFWGTESRKQSYISWAGFNFETICLKHIDQIRKALKIEGIHSTNSSWAVPGAQVDLVIQRDDHWTNLCEMKFSSETYKINKSTLENLRNKVRRYKEDTGTKDVVVITMISTFGVERDAKYHEIVESDFTMDILFQES